MAELNDEQLKQIEEAKALLSDNGLIVKTNDEFEEALTNKVNSVKSTFEREFTSEFTSNFHSKFEEEMKDFGFEKGGNEKGYELAKRVIKELKGQVDTLESKSKGADEKDALINQIQEQYKQVKDESESIKTEYENKLNDYKKGTAIEMAAKSLSFKDNIPPALLDTYLDKVKGQLLQTSKISEEGELYFTDENGDILVNKANNLKAFTAKEILEKELQDYIKQPKKQGTGSLAEKKVVTSFNGVVDEALNGATDFDSAFANYSMLAQQKGIFNGSSQFREDYHTLQKHFNVN